MAHGGPGLSDEPTGYLFLRADAAWETAPTEQ